jgi:aerobic-type carbon monoxide dehydrogenase small subunit (CoxS/CutS family)
MTNEPHDHSQQGWYGGPDEYGDGRAAQPYGWGGESDADATAFVQLPPGGLPGSGPDPLAAPGTGQGGWEPPRIDPAAGTGAPGSPMTPSAGTDPAATGQWTMPFAAQPPEPAPGTGGAMSRGPAAALGQGAAAALAGSHEARTHRRPLGAGGAAGADDAAEPDPSAHTGAPHGGAPHAGGAEEWPEPAPSPSWRADQEATLADALARRQVPLPGTGTPPQASGWDTAGQVPPPYIPHDADVVPAPEAHQAWPAEPAPGTEPGHAWQRDEQPPADVAGTPPHGFPAAPAQDPYAGAHPHAPADGPEGAAAHPAAPGGFAPAGPGAPYDTWAGAPVPPADAAHPENAEAHPAVEPAAAPGPEPAAGGHEPDEASVPAAAGEPAPEPAAADAEPAVDRGGDGPAEAPAEAAAAAPEGEEPVPEPPAAPVTVSDHPHISYLLHVNGADRPVSEAWIGESLLYVLRERLGLAGAKDGCSQGECGACSVQMDGRLVAACLVPAATAVGTDIRTVEGLAGDDGPSDVQRALAASGAVQCGFCVPGIAMAVHDLLAGNHAPTELETRQALCGNLCRCSGYRGVLDAVQQVAAERADRAAREAAEAEAAESPYIPQQAQYGGGEGVR